MKALFLGTLAASQATPIIEFITADVRTEILDNNEPAQAAAALADADVLLTGAWRSGFPAAPKLRLLQVPLAGTDGIDVSSLPRGVTLCNAYGHEPALGEFAIMMMLGLAPPSVRHRNVVPPGMVALEPDGGRRGARGDRRPDRRRRRARPHRPRSRVARGRARLPGACRQPNDAREAGLGRICLFMDGTRPDAWRVRHRCAELCPNPRDDGAD